MKFLLWRSWFTIPEPPTEQTVTQPEGRAVKKQRARLCAVLEQ